MLPCVEENRLQGCRRNSCLAGGAPGYAAEAARSVVHDLHPRLKAGATDVSPLARRTAGGGASASLTDAQRSSMAAVVLFVRRADARRVERAPLTRRFGFLSYRGPHAYAWG